MKRLALVLALLGSLALPARADSLLDESAGNLYAPPPPRLGDLITILIVDQVNATQSVTARSTVADSTQGPAGEGLLALLPLFEISTGGEHQRQQLATSQSTFQDTVTARVVAVEPNGLLKVEASRLVVLDGRERRLTFRGVLRPQDVQADNRIASSQIAEATLDVEGMSSSPVGGGLLTWLLSLFR